MHRHLEPTVIADARTAGASCQVLDYEWGAFDEIVDCEPQIRVRWRFSPYHVKIRGRTDHGEERSFGKLMVHAADEPTYARAGTEKERSRVLVCRFEQGWLPRLVEKPIDLDYGSLPTNLALQHPHIDFAMRRLMEELLQPGLASAALVEGLSILIAGELLDLCVGASCQSPSSYGTLGARRLQQIHQFIDSYEEGCPSLSEVADECGVTIAHLRRFYKATTGSTLYRRIEDSRLKRAMQMLRDTDTPLKVISHKLGFSHPSGFSLAFKRASGESPREFRMRHSKPFVFVN